MSVGIRTFEFFTREYSDSNMISHVPETTVSLTESLVTIDNVAWVGTSKYEHCLPIPGHRFNIRLALMTR